MKVIDKTPLQNEKGEIGTLQRLRGTMEFGLTWYPELEAQKTVIAQMERVLEKGYTLIRNVTLGTSPITVPLILVGPPGVYVIYVTPQSGFFEAKGDQWNQIKNGHPYPAAINLMQRVGRLARAVQVYLDRQGVSLPGPVEPILMSSSPAMHIDSLRPIVRVVLSDAVRQFAGSLLQARPVLKPELVFDIGERIVTPRPKAAAPAEAQEVQTPDYVAAGLRNEEEPAPSRARAIFHAAEDAKPFDPADLNFAFDENAAPAEGQVPHDLREPSPSQQLPSPAKGRAFSPRQWILLGGMLLLECCVLAGFAYLIFFGTR
jgi:hypothetical protein